MEETSRISNKQNEDGLLSNKNRWKNAKEELLFEMNELMTVRRHNLIPRSQYDIPISPKFHIPGVCGEYWELIPLFSITGFSIFILFYAIGWAIMHKVDTVFTTHSRKNISRTMDLRSPTVHKMLIINQRYKPWPEMQTMLDRMKQEECKRYAKASVA